MPNTNNPEQLNVTLKEWSIVCDALVQGAQIILFRKGGIREVEGRFKTEADKFLLFPTFEHQKQSHLKDIWGYLVNNTPPKDSVSIPGWCEVDSCYLIKSEAEIEAIEDQHIFNELYLTQRFEFNPYDPLTMLILRVHRFNNPITVPLLPEYMGCRSWIKINDEISLANSSPVLRDDEFEAMKQKITDCIPKALKYVPPSKQD